MRIKDLTPGLEVAVRDFGVHRAVVLDHGWAWPTYGGPHKWAGYRGVAVACETIERDGAPAWRPAVVQPAQILAPWPEYVRQEAEKEERRRAEREVQLAKALEYTKRVEAIRSGLSGLGIESWVIDRDEDRVSISFEEAERLIERLKGG